jgi:hypothetical protein
VVNAQLDDQCARVGVDLVAVVADQALPFIPHKIRSVLVELRCRQVQVEHADTLLLGRSLRQASCDERFPLQIIYGLL